MLISLGFILCVSALIVIWSSPNMVDNETKERYK